MWPDVEGPLIRSNKKKKKHFCNLLSRLFANYVEYGIYEYYRKVKWCLQVVFNIVTIIIIMLKGMFNLKKDVYVKRNVYA